MIDKNDLIRAISGGGFLFDGGMGSMLIAAGLEIGAPPEGWNLSNPDVVRGIHQSYLEAGARVVGTNTFGATPSRMAGFGLGEDLDKVNNAAVALAREAVEGANIAPSEAMENFVALSVGPTGKMFAPVGTADEGEIRAEFEGQIKSIKEKIDLVLVETMFDLREALIAVEAAKEYAAVPVAATLTFTKTPRGFFTIMGNECEKAIKQLEASGVDVVGANCTIASPEMVELAQTLRDSTSLPVLCQPNAGSPAVKDGMPVYEQSPGKYADDVLRLFELGINAVGGCCGTTPDFTREVFSRMNKE
jgi:methionine synthase I (cobalamin-dependent)